MEVIFMFLMFFMLVGLSLNDISGNQQWSRLLNKNTLTFLIIFWLLTGFVLMIHFSTFTFLYSGPEAVHEPLFGFKNIVLTFIPIVLILSSQLVKNKAKKVFLISFELGLWLFLYLFAKGQYGWGYHTSGYYKVYDLIAMVLRMLLLLQFLNIKEHKFSLAWVFAYSFMMCKIAYFSHSCF